MAVYSPRASYGCTHKLLREGVCLTCSSWCRFGGASSFEPRAPRQQGAEHRLVEVASRACWLRHSRPSHRPAGHGGLGRRRGGYGSGALTSRGGAGSGLPAEGAFDDPALREGDEAVGVGPFDDLERRAGGLARPLGGLLLGSFARDGSSGVADLVAGRSVGHGEPAELPALVVRAAALDRRRAALPLKHWKSKFR